MKIRSYSGPSSHSFARLAGSVLAIAALTVTSLAAPAAFAGGRPAPGGGGHPHPHPVPIRPIGFLQLLARANTLAHQGFLGVGLLEADGTPNGGKGTSAASVQTWRFVFNAHLPGCRQGTVLVFYRHGRFSRQFICSPFLEDRVIPLPLKRDLATAVNLLHGAGFTKPFGAVTVRWPINPGNKEPFYIFGIRSGATVTFVFVGINSGTVHVGH